MKNVLFLEGPIQTGKSTLIREILGEHLQECGGFTSQRLVDSTGETRGFRIGPAATTPLTAPLGGMRPGPAPAVDPAFFHGMDPSQVNDSVPEASPLPQPEYLLTSPDGSIYSGIFKYFDRMGSVHKDQEVFDVLGTFLLTSSKGRPLVLLDEIGGSELLSVPFRTALYDLLTSGVPCLGVIKLEKNARRMQRSYGFDSTEPNSTEPNSTEPATPAKSAVGTEQAVHRPVTPAPQPIAPAPRPIASAPRPAQRSIADWNRQLRSDIIDSFDGRVAYFDRSDTACYNSVKAELTSFLRQIFPDIPA